jgi:precorrin-2 dehydrogenase / sirohydrochlorin ferrochelatase
MVDFPIMLKVSGRKCVVIGGGPVAVRRAKALAEAGAQVLVVAMAVDPEMAGLGVKVCVREAREEDLDGALVVVLATGDAGVNERMGAAARARGALVNRADDASEGDFSVPAHAHHGPVTVAVHTSGISAGASAAIRKELSETLDEDWVRLLELVRPYRERIQGLGLAAGERQRRLKVLGSGEMLALLKREGPGAVVAVCEELVN